jgi:hypothetical protein
VRQSLERDIRKRLQCIGDGRIVIEDPTLRALDDIGRRQALVQGVGDVKALQSEPFLHAFT